MRLALPLLVLLVGLPAVAARQPVVEANPRTLIQTATKLHRAEDIGGPGQRVIASHGRARRPRITTAVTTVDAHRTVMARTILGGNTPAAAIFGTGGARVELATPSSDEYDAPVYTVTGVKKVGAEGKLLVRALLPVSGHVQSMNPAPDAHLGVQIQASTGPWWLASTPREYADAVRASGGRSFRGAPILATSTPFDTRGAIGNAGAFARDTVHRVVVAPAGSSERQVIRVGARGLVTDAELTLTLRPGRNRIELAPERSGGPAAFMTGRVAYLDWNP